jgi:hypothetical protein
MPWLNCRARFVIRERDYLFCISPRKIRRVIFLHKLVCNVLQDRVAAYNSISNKKQPKPN